MSKKHYIAIANLLYEQGVDRELCESLASYFKQENRAFDFNRFMVACGFKD